MSDLINSMMAAILLVKLNELMDWSLFTKSLKTLRSEERKSNAGRKLYDSTLMFKNPGSSVVVQSL